MPPNPQSLATIDADAHAEVSGNGHASLPPALLTACTKYFGTDGPGELKDNVAAWRGLNTG